VPGHAAVVLRPRPGPTSSDALTALPRKVPGARP
jgi:hypothetical protein